MGMKEETGSEDLAPSNEELTKDVELLKYPLTKKDNLPPVTKSKLPSVSLSARSYSMRVDKAGDNRDSGQWQMRS
ncbi:hypothetical protein N7466_010537 [Penicillium verhagenii]|uniref:uncharacterized protein n=1 Tax=Penicillium verhagenii TaxID=1562060 RepID=UPI0025459E53|nr:uncharacterized protein N7466_010537 [Penicillium verhagenii]KAJ5918545.1 hypothetical protein N7466_010537 [Penicillium verhagenii]